MAKITITKRVNPLLAAPKGKGKGKGKKKGTGSASGGSKHGKRAEVYFQAEAWNVPLSFRSGERVKPVKGAALPKWLSAGEAGMHGYPQYTIEYNGERLSAGAFLWHFGAAARDAKHGTAEIATRAALKMLAHCGANVSTYLAILNVGNGYRQSGESRPAPEPASKAMKAFIAGLLAKWAK